jgi:hypothetical protein
MIVRRNDGLRIRTYWRFAIVKFKGKFSLFMPRRQTGVKYSSSLTSPQNEMDVDRHLPDPATLLQERSTVEHW